MIDKALSVVQETVDPIMETTKMPVVTNNWKKVPKVPRILTSAISEMYIGTNTQKLPVATPIKINQQLLLFT